MLNKVKRFFEGGGFLGGADEARRDHTDEEHRIAAAALLLEAARLDAEEHPAETEAIVRLIRQRFDLSAAEADQLIELASRRQEAAIELHGFTHLVKTKFSHDERVELIEMLWEVVYADGRLHDYEANLMRRIGGLVHVSDRERGEARRRVLKKLGLDAK